jgi:rhodanese-related sulfurtransferase
LDVRTKDELKQGIINNSINISFINLLSKLRNNFASLNIPLNKFIIVICSDGIRSKLAAQMIK